MKVLLQTLALSLFHKSKTCNQMVLQRKTNKYNLNKEYSFLDSIEWITDLVKYLDALKDSGVSYKHQS